MDTTLRKSLHDIARDIIDRRKASFTRPLDPDAERFCEDALIEGLHSNDAFLHWYGRARDAEDKIKAMLQGASESEKHLSAQLRDSLAEVEKLRGQLRTLSRFTGFLPPTPETAAPSVAVKAPTP